LVELHVKVDIPPADTAGGAAASVAVGAAGRDFTVIAAVAAGLVPPGPVQVIEKVEFTVSAPVVREPLGASAPLQSPEALHAVA
jgi:hypothetical protein